MPSGKSCICKDKNMDNWSVLHYKHNHSAFESPKYGEHYSDYSIVKCEACGMVWSTKAKYVDRLK